MKRIIDERLADRKRRVERRLDKNRYPADRAQPVLRSPGVQFELAGRGVGTSYGGLALVQQLVRRLGLAQAIDERLQSPRRREPSSTSCKKSSPARSTSCRRSLRAQRTRLTGFG